MLLLIINALSGASWCVVVRMVRVVRGVKQSGSGRKRRGTLMKYNHETMITCSYKVQYAVNQSYRHRYVNGGPGGPHHRSAAGRVSIGR